ncbi:D-amino acid dehydrogenase [Oceanibacterium hippocampi]|uniref:D-amino acid dehydrogenase small subunit n=1 Tax=Oceanibacterium hippocampi TaxID=745714 RepID=A0A1Y5T7S6_9PROT|nr:D-amino acid dehydrogenase [Oceanibacterium hippocampi]SLN57346.1 D-amino acid dehydrogenase small subunit [Oceanibacterium hippocampi]
MKVIVLGAGVVGVSLAYMLAGDGHEVVVLERRDGAALGTSFANGGQISASQPFPWASGKVPGRLIRWLGRDDAPLAVRLRADPAMWSWALRFLMRCTTARNLDGAGRALRLAMFSRGELRRLRHELGLSYDAEERGILKLYRDPRSLEEAAAHAEWLGARGIAQTLLDRDGCVAVEPALATGAAGIAGGTYTAEDESGDAHRYTRALAERGAALGVVFRFDTAVRALEADGARIVAAATDAGPVRGDAFVLAAGVDAPALVRPLGLRLPVYPVKGYSVTIPVGGSNAAPHVSITDEDRYVVMSRLGDRLRAAGTAELAGHDTTPNRRRSGAVLDAVMSLFPDAGDAGAATHWAGLRPMTPDGVPLIGPTPYANLFLDTGHGTLGWTMAAGSARVLAELVAGRPSPIDLDGLTMQRFQKGRGRARETG